MTSTTDIFGRMYAETDLHVYWRQLMHKLRADPLSADGTFFALARCYQEPQRHYHTLTHLGQMLALVQPFLAACAEDAANLELAIWGHDVVYDTRADDNEERSATWLSARLQELRLPEHTARVRELILCTRAHEAAAADETALLLLDADLAILGSPESVYREYAANIRREYAWVPEDSYRRGRSAILQRFLERAAIYHVPELHAALEGQARQNLQNELLLLSGEPL